MPICLLTLRPPAELPSGLMIGLSQVAIEAWKMVIKVKSIAAKPDEWGNRGGQLSFFLSILMNFLVKRIICPGWKWADFFLFFSRSKSFLASFFNVCTFFDEKKLRFFAVIYPKKKISHFTKFSKKYHIHFLLLFLRWFTSIANKSKYVVAPNHANEMDLHVLARFSKWKLLTIVSKFCKCRLIHLLFCQFIDYML